MVIVWADHRQRRCRGRIHVDAGIIAVDTGPVGVRGYSAARRLVAMGYPKVLWHYGGEAVWAKSGAPAEDRREGRRDDRLDRMHRPALSRRGQDGWPSG